MHKKILLAVSLLASMVATAQTLLPIDTAVRIGKLPNGMTYYIRHNELPKNSVDFHIAQQVGSILEEENQRGLAHFLEHMAFNGTKHFPESESFRNYLESIGVKFGANLNAYTSIDETVYMITNVPTTRTGIIDTCLLILHDWSNALLLTDEEIDKERGVIHEEWRTRQSSAMRMYEQLLPEIYGTDRYAHRLPIGLMSVVDNFKYQELRDYYKKWYRPDLQGIVIVGDIDVDDVEKRIKTIFADIPAPVNPAVREYYPVSNNDEPIFSIATDAEATMTYLLMFYKHDAVPNSIKNTQEYLILSYIQAMAVNMFNARMDEISQKKSAPFTFAQADDCDFFLSKTKDAWELQLGCKDGMTDSALACITHEMQRVKRYGFTETEYIRAKADFLKSLENSYNERNKEKNSHYTQQYIDNFLDAEPITSIDFDYTFFNRSVDEITVSDINSYMDYLITDKNIVVMLMGNTESKLPSKQELAEVFAKAQKDSVTAYIDNTPDVNLIKKQPKQGKTKSEKAGPFDSKEIMLKNGIKVILKPTDFKQDEILMTAFSMGGTSLLDEKQMPTILLLDDLIDLGGLANFSSLDLQKVLAGKNVSLAPHISLNAESFAGGCAPSDFETLLQLIYLYFTQPRSDNDVYEAYIASVETLLEKAEQNPDFALKDSIYHTIYGNHPRAKILKKEDISSVDYSLAMKMYNERFLNNDNFTFVFVGNLPDSTQLWIEKYLGALPKIKQSESYKDTRFEPRKGEWSNTFGHSMEIPKTTVYVNYSGTCEYTLGNNIKMSILKQLMDIVYTKTIREDEGGTYGVRVSGDLSKLPNETFEFRIYFDTAPEKSSRMKDIMYEQLDKLSKDGFADEDFLKVKEYMQKNFKEVLIENSYWLSLLKEYYMIGVDRFSAYEQTLNNITKEDIRLFLNDILKQNNKAEIVMMPKE